MKIINKLVICMFFFMQWQHSIASAQSVQEVHHKLPLTVDNLTRQSYISPKMQWAVISLLDTPAFFEINKYTMFPEYIPTVQELLKFIEMQILLPVNKKEYDGLQEVLEIMLQATDTALAVVEIKVAYKDPLFLPLSTILSQGLNKQKKEILVMRDALNAIKRPSMSWRWKNGFLFKKNFLAAENIVYNETLETIKIPVRYMQAITYNTNYEQQKNVTYAANLLCKQCLLAQQPYNNHRIVSLQIKDSFSTIGYLYSNILDIYNPHIHSYPLCNDIVLRNGKMHIDLVYLRQAIQTALAIVHRNIAMHESHISHFLKNVHLHALADELAKYDMHVQALCTGRIIEKENTSDEWFVPKVLTAAVITAIFAKIAYGYYKNIVSLPVPSEFGKKSNITDLEQVSEEQSSDQGNNVDTIEIKKDGGPVQGKVTDIIEHVQQEKEKVCDQLEQKHMLPKHKESWIAFFNNMKSKALDKLQDFYQDFISSKVPIDTQVEEEDWGAAYERSAKADEEDRKNRERLRGNSERTSFLRRYIFGPSSSKGEDILDSQIGDHASQYSSDDDSQDMPPLENIDEETLREYAAQSLQEQSQEEQIRNNKNTQNKKHKADEIVQDFDISEQSQAFTSKPSLVNKKIAQHWTQNVLENGSLAEKKPTGSNLLFGHQGSLLLNAAIHDLEGATKRTSDDIFDDTIVSMQEKVTSATPIDAKPERSSIHKLREEKIVTRQLDRLEPDRNELEMQSQEEIISIRDKTTKNKPREVRFAPKAEYENQATTEDTQESLPKMGLRERSSAPLSQADEVVVQRLQQKSPNDIA